MAISRAALSTATYRNGGQAGEQALRQLGFAPDAIREMVRSHGSALNSLFGHPQAPMALHRKEGGFQAVKFSDAKLPSGMGGLAHAMAQLAPRQALPFLARAIECPADVPIKIQIAAACVQALANAAGGSSSGTSSVALDTLDAKILCKGVFELMATQAVPDEAKSLLGGLLQFATTQMSADDLQDLPAMLEGIAVQAMKAKAEPSVPANSLEGPALVLAAAAGQLEAVELLLARGASLAVTDSRGNTPLHVASAAGHADAVRLLVKWGANINASRASDGCTALHLACAVGRTDVVKALLENPGIQVNQARDDGGTALHAAAHSMMATPEAVKLLLADGRVDVNAQRADGATPLCAAMHPLANPAVVQALLVDSRVDAEKPDTYGWTPLHLAAAQCPEMAHVLLDARKQHSKTLVDHTDPWGAKPVAVAAECGGDTRLVERLRQLTSVQPAWHAGSIATSYDKGCLVRGYDALDEALGTPKRTAPAGVQLAQFPDGQAGMSWKAFKAQDVAPGAFAIVDCHGAWDAQRKRHMLQFGKGEEVPTIEVVRELYRKGVRKMTFFSCRVGMTAEALMRCINEDPGWPKPIDPEFEICVVGGKKDVPTTVSAYDIDRRLTDHDARREHRAGGSMERLTVSNWTTLRWDAGTQGMVMKRERAPKSIDRENLTPDEIKSVQGRRLIKRACGPGLEKLRNALQDLDEPGLVNFQGVMGDTALHVAALHGWTDGVQMLLEQPQVLPDIRTPVTHATALILACSKGHWATAQRLLAHPGIDADAPAVGGTTPLIAACLAGRAEFVRLLLKTFPQLKVNEQDRRGLTALHAAAQRGDIEVVGLLMACPSLEPDRADISGSTPLDIACERGEDVMVARMLGDSRINIARDFAGLSALSRAVRAGHVAIVKRLVDAMVHRNVFPGTMAMTLALTEAKRGANPEIVAVLESLAQRARAARNMPAPNATRPAQTSN
ncbi:MAG: ankyrin repeat domain-containing protein [Pseudomonadota bacterium]